ncbi:hypothetical protein [Aliiglaciecola sp. CAU 1673]|uniref:hypothetical protein n=1 Tax=Aliiglaciecola sp. CAU 1673 TaxID=3032595 RepID=UPI0023DB81B5|nr:hypothetical protein [Aliiglaciecola sp. CAU 1673]
MSLWGYSTFFSAKPQLDVDAYSAVVLPKASLHRPRILQPVIGGAEQEASFCDSKGLGNVIACVAVAPDEANIQKAFEVGAAFKPEKPKVAGGKHHAWLLALLLDQIATYKATNALAYEQMIKTLSLRLEDYLALLDGRSASMWHSRVSLASHAFIVATAIAEHQPAAYQRAAQHFLDTVNALAITEAWPNGFNYWINNRAFVFLLATSAYVNGSDADNKDEVLSIASRLGLWQIYMTRPDHRIESIADEGPRVDLKDESQRVMDLLAKLTRNPVFSTYSAYIETRWGREGYYSGYRWLKPFLKEPDIHLLSEDPSDLSFLNGVLPTFAVFGEGAYNQVVMRSDWGAEGLFVQARAGQTFSHHQHYDAGHFTFFYKHPLLVDGGVYSRNYYKDSRLNYSLRTVAKNSILLPMHGEEIRPNKFFTQNVNEGGQNILMPTGSAIVSTSHWRKRSERTDRPQGARLRRAVELPFSSAFVEFELEQAYNRPEQRKVQRLSRSLLFLPESKTLLLRDRALGLKEGVSSKLVFHPKTVPEGATDSVSESSTGVYDIPRRHELNFVQSPLVLTSLLGGEIGGRAFVGHPYRFYVESYLPDGGTEILDQSAGYQPSPWFDEPAARIELNARLEGEGSLIALDVSAHHVEPQIKTGNGFHLVELSSDIVLYVDEEKQSIRLPSLVKPMTVISEALSDSIELVIGTQKVTLSLQQGVGRLGPGLVQPGTPT